MLINEFRRFLQVVVAYFRSQPQYYLGGNEENNEKSSTRLPPHQEEISGPQPLNQSVLLCTGKGQKTVKFSL
jgi:hypothetical protein